MPGRTRHAAGKRARKTYVAPVSDAPAWPLANPLIQKELIIAINERQ